MTFDPTFFARAEKKMIAGGYRAGEGRDQGVPLPPPPKKGVNTSRVFQRHIFQPQTLG